MPRDWVKFPELRNSEFDLYYWESPHKQITEDFLAKVENVHDGDTITVSTDFRDFNFKIRFLGTNAPELNERGGDESRDWLENIIMGEEVEIRIDKKNRVGKFGRLLGEVIHAGINMNKASIREGWAVPFERSREGLIPKIEKILNQKRWFK